MTRTTSIRLLAVGHGHSATGFSRVLHGILEHLPSHYDLHHFAVNHRSDRIEAGIPTYGNPIDGDMHGLERLSELCDTLRPDVLLILGDLWFASIHAVRLRRLSRRPLMALYAPVDGRVDGIPYGRELVEFDRVVAYTEFGRGELARNILEHGGARASDALERLDVIPHGIDTERFFPHALDADGLPSDDRRIAKQLFFGAGSPLVDSFIVLNASKHQPRKRIDLTIEGFARFAEGKPENVKLYLHAGVDMQGPDLRQIARRFGVADRLILSDGAEEGHPAVGDATLNLLYNACDVGINTSGGEGWGLVSFEHAATGAPQIVPRHSACEELWRGGAIMLEPATTFRQRALGIEWGFVDPEEVARGLERLYGDRQLRRMLAVAAYRRATRSAYSWSTIAGRWDRLLTGMMERRHGTFAMATSLATDAGRMIVDP